MSEEKRKNARTQGRYSGGDKEYSSRHQDKQSSKMPSTDNHKGEKRKAPVVGSRAQNKIDLQYEEESTYSFKELEPVKKPQEIRFTEPMLHLSETDNGVSRMIYNPDFLKLADADNYMEQLRDTTKWHDKNIVIRGVEYPQPRLVAWYGPHPYTYAGATLEAREMPKIVLEIKEKVEASLRQYGVNVELNSVLLNWYRNEKDSVAWHSDDELSLGVCPTIASVSLGETRRFEIRPKEHVTEFDAFDISYVNLTHGSLIVMDGCMQQDWLHRVPKEYHARQDRINLTFRTIYPIDELPPQMSHVSNIKFAKSPSEKVLHQEDPKFDTESFPPLGMEARVSNMKFAKSAVEKMVHQQDPKFDTEIFPPLGMEATDKKTKLLSKENGNKDYQQPAVQRKSPKEPWGGNDKKTKFLPKGGSKSYQQSVSQRKSKKEEDWDGEMLQGVEDTPTIQNNLNKITSHDPVSSSPESHPSQIDFNSNIEESAKLCDKQFLPCSVIKKEYYSGAFEKYQSPNCELTDRHSLESEDPSLSNSKPDKIKEEPSEINAKASDSGKKYMLNADAPDFIPVKKFENYSLSELAECSYQLKNEELHSFKEVILNRVDEHESIFMNRDLYELDTYFKLTQDGLISDKHLKIILERIGSMIKNALFKQNDPRYTNRYQNRSYDDNNHHKHKQSYGRSPRY